MSMLDKPWVPGLPPHQQHFYQPLQYCTYCPVLGSFNNWDIITLSHKYMTSEAFEEMHQVVLDGIINDMDHLFQSVKYGAMNTTDYTNMGYCVVNYVSENYNL